MILDEHRVVVRVHRRSTESGIEKDVRLFRHEDGNQPALGVPCGRSLGAREIVDAEDIRGRRLRIAAGAVAPKELVPVLGLVPAAAVPVIGDVAGELLVVASFGVGRIEIGRVVDRAVAGADERRVDDVRAGAAVILERESPLRILELGQRACPEHAPVVGVGVPIWILSIDLAGLIDDQRLDARIVRPLARVVEKRALDRVICERRARHLDLAALVLIGGRQNGPGLLQRR